MQLLLGTCVGQAVCALLIIQPLLKEMKNCSNILLVQKPQTKPFDMGWRTQQAIGVASESYSMKVTDDTFARSNKDCL